MSKQTTAPGGPKRRPGWKLPLAALVAAGMILGAQSIGVFGGLSSVFHDKGSGSASEAAAGPQQIVDETVAEFDAIVGTTADDATGRAGAGAADAQAELEARIAEIRARYDAAQADALSRADTAVADAEAQVDRVAARAPFPQLPDDYLPGAPVEVGVPAVPGYGLPTFGTQELGGFVATPWDAVPSGITDAGGLPIPETGEGDVDEAGSTANGAYMAAKQILEDNLGGGTPLDDDETVQNLTNELRTLWTVLGVPAPFPLDEGTGDEADPFDLLEGADDMAEPDEDGAIASKLHAEELLGTGDFVMDQRIAGLQTVSGEHLDLIDAIRADLQDAQKNALTSEANIMLELQQRLDDALAAGEAEEAALNRRVDALAAEAQEKAESAQADLEKRFQAEATAITAEADEAAGELESEAKARLTDAQTRQAQVQAAAKAALEQLQALEAADEADYSAYADAIIADALDAEKRIWGDAKTESDALAGEAQAIRGDAEAQVAELQSRLGGAKADTQARVADVQGELEDRHAYAVALARAKSDALVGAHTAAADKAVGDVQADFVAYKDKTFDAAWDYQEKAEEWVGDSLDVANFVAATADDYVQDDIAYIEGVAEDYFVQDQTTPDDDDQGAKWAGIAVDLGHYLNATVGDATTIQDVELGPAESALATGRIALSNLQLEF